MMKYRDHSLRYTKRPLQAKPERVSHHQPPAAEPEETRIVRTNTDEPLIDVHDFPSRFDALKETIGGVIQEFLTSVVPKIKHLVINLLSQMRVVVTFIAKKIHFPTRGIDLSKVTKKQMIVILLICIVGVLAAGRISSQLGLPVPLKNNSSISDQNSLADTTPNYETLLPEDKTIESLGGWARVSPPDRNPVFAFVDTIAGTKVTVSQQPLPDDFSGNTELDVKELALNFNAKERLVADDATVFYIGNSTKGPQSVILAKRQTLILIKSPIQLEKDVWSAYIASLR